VIGAPIIEYKDSFMDYKFKNRIQKHAVGFTEFEFGIVQIKQHPDFNASELQDIIQDVITVMVGPNGRNFSN
jgi:hypothetical protein